MSPNHLIHLLKYIKSDYLKSEIKENGQLYTIVFLKQKIYEDYSRIYRNIIDKYEWLILVNDAVNYVDNNETHIMSVGYYKNGKLHNKYHPAVVWNTGNCYYWYNGVIYKNIKSNLEFTRKIKLLAFK